MSNADADELAKVRAALPFNLSRTRQGISELVAELVADRRMLHELARYAPEALNPELRAKAIRHRLKSSEGVKRARPLATERLLILEKSKRPLDLWGGLE